MANILVVTRDIAEYLVYSVLVTSLRGRGHTVTVIAEGQSFAKWLEVGERLYVSSKRPWTVFEQLEPSLVLTGLGAPIRLGEKFGLAANKLSIKLGYVTDIWGAERRSSAVPNFICTLDSFGKRQIQEYAPYYQRMPRIYITGSPAMDRLSLDVKHPGGIWEEAGDYKAVVLLVGQDEATIPAIKGLVKSLNDWGESYLLIPCVHPKRPDLSDLWEGILAEATGFVLRSPQLTTQQLMKVATHTVSVYSNALVEAATLGSLPISWVSPIGRQKMRKSLGLDQFPLVDCGCAIEVETPAQFRGAVLDLSPAAYAAKVHRCRSVCRCDGDNTKRVVAAIERELVIP